MGTTDFHLGKARNQKSNFLAIATHPEHGDENGMVQHASLTVEHLIKALIANQFNEKTNCTGHKLGELYDLTDYEIDNKFEEFMYKIDGMYTAARYDEGFSTDLMNDVDKTITLLEQFISYTETFVQTRRELSSQGERAE